MKLIAEQIVDVEYISEARENGEKEHFIRGIFLQAEQKNRNGRIYRKPILEKELERYIRENVNSNRAYGELGHPQGPSINLDRVSHMITELKWSGNDVYGKAKITETPMGNIVKGLLKSGANLGVSSRGMGSLVEKNGIMEVQDDFHLATAADIVADPSAPNAFVEGIMENVDWIYDQKNGIWVQETAEKIKTQLKKMKMDEIENNKFAVFENFINSISTTKKII
jgi:Prohead core protein serine protease